MQAIGLGKSPEQAFETMVARADRRKLFTKDWYLKQASGHPLVPEMVTTVAKQPDVLLLLHEASSVLAVRTEVASWEEKQNFSTENRNVHLPLK